MISCFLKAIGDLFHTESRMWNPSLFIGSIIESHEHRVAILPKRIKDSMPSPEPKPGDNGWLYRVLEPYYSRECGLNRLQNHEKPRI